MRPLTINRKVLGKNEAVDFNSNSNMANMAIQSAFQNGRLSDTDLKLGKESVPSAEDTLQNIQTKIKTLRDLLDKADKTPTGTYKISTNSAKKEAAVQNELKNTLDVKMKSGSKAKVTEIMP